MRVYCSRHNSTHVGEKLEDFHRLFAGLLLIVSKHPAGPATDRPTGHLNTGWFSWFSARCVQANVEMVAKIPSSMLLVQPSMFNFTKINLLAVK